MAYAAAQRIAFGRASPFVALVGAGMLLAGCGGLTLPDAASLMEPVKTATDAKPTAPADPQAELAKATQHWGQEFAKNPNNPKIALNYAKNLKAMGHKQQALAVLQHAAVHGGDNRELASEYGRLALDLGQVALAERLLKQADDPTKPDWRVISAQGTALAKQGRHREAQPYFERALALSPNNPSVMNNLAMAYALDGQAAKAEALLRQAAALPDANPRVHQNLALVLGLQGKFDESKQLSVATLPPDKAEQNNQYLRKMVDVRPVPATTVTRKQPAVEPAQVAKATAKDLKTQPREAVKKEITTNTWSTEVARNEAPVPVAPARQ
jgi:Flp pilus assembly protein TadD